MDNVPIEGGRIVGAPDGWDANLDGDCLAISVHFAPPDFTTTPGWAKQTTAWRFSAEELGALQEGGVFLFSLTAPFVPVMNFSVQDRDQASVGTLASSSQALAAVHKAVLGIALELDRRAPNSRGRSRLEPLDLAGLLEATMELAQGAAYQVTKVPIVTLDDLVQRARQDRQPGTPWPGVAAPADVQAEIERQLRGDAADQEPDA